MADSHLTQEELRAIRELKQDAVRLTKRNDTILDVIVLLEEAMKEIEKDKRQIQIWLEQYAELATENKELRQRITELEKEQEGDAES